MMLMQSSQPRHRFVNVSARPRDVLCVAVLHQAFDAILSDHARWEASTSLSHDDTHHASHHAHRSWVRAYSQWARSARQREDSRARPGHDPTRNGRSANDHAPSTATARARVSRAGSQSSIAAKPGPGGSL